MNPETAYAAEALAHNALGLLAAALVLSATAAAIVVLTIRLTARHRELLFDRARALTGRLQQFALIGRAFGHARRLLPGGYLVLHLVIGLIATAAALAFAVLAEEIIAGRTVAAFDHAFAEALHGHASPRWQQVFRVVTWFGSTEILLVISALVAVPLWRRHRVFAIGWIIGQGGGAALNVALKNAVQRTRPEYADTFLLSPSWSFPSGHAMSTFVFCGLGAYLLLRANPSWTRVVVVSAAALSWCMLMGFTRLYLGVHFLSDVVAGIVAATAWVAVCVSGMEVALRRPRTRGYTPQSRSRRARDGNAGGRASPA